MTPQNDKARDRPVPQETVRLSGRGAGMLLGELEHALMTAVWSIGRPAPAREIHERVVRKRKVELITAVTVLNRLVTAKGLLRRGKLGDVYHYEATVSREEFLQQASRRIAERILALGSEAVTSSIVDVLAERDPEQLEELGRLIRRKLRTRDSGG